MKALHLVTWILIVVGALNWGLVGAFDFNLVNKILSAAPTIERLVYILVGLSGLVEIFSHSKTCRMCGKDNSVPATGM